MNKTSSPKYPTTETIKSVAKLWQINLKKIDEDIPIQGSPERSLFRVVLEDHKGKYFVLEQIPAKSLDRKKHIATTLDFLSRNQLQRVKPYLADENGAFVVQYENDFWQIAPFVPGVALNRKNYMYEKWRGPALADFLIELHSKVKNLPSGDAGNVFSLKDYLYKLIHEINLYNKSGLMPKNGASFSQYFMNNFSFSAIILKLSAT